MKQNIPESAVNLLFALFSSQKQLVLSSENKAILSSLINLVKKEKKKKHIDAALARTKSALEHNLQEYLDNEEEKKNSENFVYQVNLLSEVCSTANETDYFQSTLLGILDRTKTI